jgi:gentisate 1,2-dioxygenase
MTAVAAVVTASGLTLHPGVMSARRRHPGEEIVGVLEGAPLQYEVEGKPPVTLKPGDVLFIPAGTTLCGEERRQPKRGGTGHIYRRKGETAPHRGQ